MFPAVNITEDADAYYVSAELPGVNSADLDLNITANQLTLAGERKIWKRGPYARYYRRSGKRTFFTAVVLPGEIESVKSRP